MHSLCNEATFGTANSNESKPESPQAVTANVERPGSSSSAGSKIRRPSMASAPRIPLYPADAFKPFTVNPTGTRATGSIDRIGGEELRSSVTRVDEARQQQPVGNEPEAGGSGSAMGAPKAVTSRSWQNIHFLPGQPAVGEAGSKNAALADAGLVVSGSRPTRRPSTAPNRTTLERFAHIQQQNKQDGTVKAATSAVEAAIVGVADSSAISKILPTAPLPIQGHVLREADAITVEECKPLPPSYTAIQSAAVNLQEQFPIQEPKLTIQEPMIASPTALQKPLEDVDSDDEDTIPFPQPQLSQLDAGGLTVKSNNTGGYLAVPSPPPAVPTPKVPEWYHSEEQINTAPPAATPDDTSLRTHSLSNLTTATPHDHHTNRYTHPAYCTHAPSGSVLFSIVHFRRGGTRRTTTGTFGVSNRIGFLRSLKRTPEDVVSRPPDTPVNRHVLARASSVPTYPASCCGPDGAGPLERALGATLAGSHGENRVLGPACTYGRTDGFVKKPPPVVDSERQLGQLPSIKSGAVSSSERWDSRARRDLYECLMFNKDEIAGHRIASTNLAMRNIAATAKVTTPQTYTRFGSNTEWPRNTSVLVQAAPQSHFYPDVQDRFGRHGWFDHDQEKRTKGYQEKLKRLTYCNKDHMDGFLRFNDRGSDAITAATY